MATINDFIIDLNSYPLTIATKNRVFTRTSNLADGCPVYESPSKRFLWFKPQNKWEIRRKNGIWELCVDDGYVSMARKADISDSPFGVWTDGDKITG